MDRLRATPPTIRRAAALLPLLLAAILTAPGAARAEKFAVVTPAAPRLAPARTAFVDAVLGKRIVEIDRAGNVVWQCELGDARFGSDELQRGADLEWIAADDTFLLVVPFSGIFRLDRNCAVVWSHRTPRVSHDADLLPNGNVLYTFAWDDTGDSQAVEIDPAGRIVWRWQAHGHINPAWRNAAEGGGAARNERGSGRRSGSQGPGGGAGAGQGAGQGGGRGEGFTHANAVARLADGDTLVSLRNYGRVVRVAPDGRVKWASANINRVHDPSLLPDGRLVAAEHMPMTVVRLGQGQREVLFANAIDIRPIRTVEPLPNGNFLVAGGADIVEIDAAGAVLWHVRPYANLGARVREGIYKAVRVGR
ncbi:MAG: aryl-sulfate sulfotransferase [Reyranellaceae bacterium]